MARAGIKGREPSRETKRMFIYMAVVDIGRNAEAALDKRMEIEGKSQMNDHGEMRVM